MARTFNLKDDEKNNLLPGVKGRMEKSICDIPAFYFKRNLTAPSIIPPKIKTHNYSHKNPRLKNGDFYAPIEKSRVFVFIIP